MSEKLYLYDTTLRDGAQTRGVDFSVKNKNQIAAWLDELGMAYVEGGWPGANPTDDAFFAAPPLLRTGRLTAFGMTCRPHGAATEDKGLNTVLDSPACAVCLVGKSWDFHVEKALGVTLDDNLELIRSSLALAVARGKEALFDAEHFFDGYKANPAYALACLAAAHQAGASWLVLCDTNGGTLPHEIETITAAVHQALPTAQLGIHCHDDTGNAVANSLAAVRAGCRMVQGTLNGLGERCGNANLITLIPTLALKMGFDVGLPLKKMERLTAISRAFTALLDREAPTNAPYVGLSAFAHKGGLHAAAVAKNPGFYEHIAPESVGNAREIIMSNQAGLSNLRLLLQEQDLGIDANDPRMPALLAEVKERQCRGYAYDHASASFALLALKMTERLPAFFEILSFAAHSIGTDIDDKDEGVTAYASLKVRIGTTVIDTMADGNGPVNALDGALRKALVPAFPELESVRLTDFHVRILDSSSATQAVTRVLVESEDPKMGLVWVTVGVSTNIIKASLQALADAAIYRLAFAQKGQIK